MIGLICLRREGAREQQMGRKGLSNQRWIVGVKPCMLLNHLGPIVDGDCDTANVYDGVKEEMVVLADQGFAKVDWHPINLRL